MTYYGDSVPRGQTLRIIFTTTWDELPIIPTSITVTWKYGSLVRETDTLVGGGVVSTGQDGEYYTDWLVPSGEDAGEHTHNIVFVYGGNTITKAPYPFDVTLGTGGVTYGTPNFETLDNIRSEALFEREWREAGTTSKAITIQRENALPLSITSVTKNGTALVETTDYSLSYNNNGVPIVTLVADRLTTDIITLKYKNTVDDAMIELQRDMAKSLIISKLSMYSSEQLMSSPQVTTICRWLAAGYLMVKYYRSASAGEKGWWSDGDRLISAAMALLEQIANGEVALIDSTGEVIDPEGEVVGAIDVYSPSTTNEPRWTLDDLDDKYTRSY